MSKYTYYNEIGTALRDFQQVKKNHAINKKKIINQMNKIIMQSPPSHTYQPKQDTRVLHNIMKPLNVLDQKQTRLINSGSYSITMEKRRGCLKPRL